MASPALASRCSKLAKPGCVRFAESRRRLVEQQYRRRGAERPRNLDQPAVDMRQRGGQSGVRSGIADQRQQRARQIRLRFPAPRAAQKAQADIVEHAQARERLRRLKSAGKACARDVLGGKAGDLLLADAHGSCIRRAETR